MDVKLLFPPASEKYEKMTWATENLVDPPATSAAILGAIAKENFPDSDIACIGHSVASGSSLEDYQFRNRTVDEIVELCFDADVVGATTWFHNLETSIKVSEKLKAQNPDQKFVLGGFGVSDPITARLVLEQHDSIDNIVMGDGEESFKGILEGKAPNQIPNLFYREDGRIKRSFSKPFNLNERPLWDFIDTVGYKEILKGYDSKTALFRELRKDSGNLMGRIGVQFTTGCEKAEKEGPCSYCTSNRTEIQVMSAKKFWKQIEHLYETHGSVEYLISDDIVATLPKLNALTEARESVSVPDNIQFRAYGYAPYFTSENSQEMVRLMKEVGIVNLFLGIENFSQDVNEHSHKRAYSFGEIERTIEDITHGGIDIFLPLIIGMPGETEKTLSYNAECLNKLLEWYGKRQYGEGGIVRVDLSGGMPLRGTPWYMHLARDEGVKNFYHSKTGVQLDQHIDPDYAILRAASTRYFKSTGITNGRLEQHKATLGEICLRYLRPEQIGGFDFQPSKDITI